MLRAKKQESLFHGIFPDCAGKVTIRNTVHNFCPGFAVIPCSPDIRCSVVYLVPVCSHIGGAWCVGRFFNDRDPGELWHIGRGDFCPGVTAVPSDVHQSVIGTSPDGINIVLRRCQGKDSGINLGPIHIHGDESTGGAEGRWVSVGQIRTDLFPALPVIFRKPDMLGTGIKLVIIQRGKDNGEGPLPPLGKSACRFS